MSVFFGSVPIVRPNTSATSPRSLCTAGTTMWLGWLVVELLDALAEVGLDDLDATRSRGTAASAFVGQHRLALHQRRRAVRLQDVEDDLVVLGRVAGPMDDHAVGGRLLLELLEIVAEMGERVFLDRRGERAQLLPFRQGLALAVALLAQVPEALVVEVGVSPSTSMNLEDASA